MEMERKMRLVCINSQSGYGKNMLDTVMNAFVFYNGDCDQNGGLALDESGENIIAPFTTEGWKEGTCT